MATPVSSAQNLPKKGTPLSAFAKPVKQDSGPSFKDSLVETGKKLGSYVDPAAYWTNLSNTVGEYLDALKEDVKGRSTSSGSISTDLAKEIKLEAKTALDVLGLASSPLGVGIDQTIIQPAKDAIQTLGNLVEDHLSDDGSRQGLTLQQRREAYPDKLPKRKLDLSLHAEDVQQTVEGIQSFLDPLVNALSFFALPEGEAGRLSIEKTAGGIQKTADAAEGKKALADADRAMKPRGRIVIGPDGKPMIVPAEPPLESRVYNVEPNVENTLDLRLPEHKAIYEEARKKHNAKHAGNIDEQFPSITTPGFISSRSGLPSFGHGGLLLDLLPEFDSVHVDEGPSPPSLRLRDGTKATITDKDTGWYHGSPNKEISQFQGQIHVTKSKSNAQLYADGSVLNAGKFRPKKTPLEMRDERPLQGFAPKFEPTRVPSITQKIAQAGRILSTDVGRGKATTVGNVGKKLVEALGPTTPLGRAIERTLKNAQDVLVLGSPGERFAAKRTRGHFQPAENGGFIEINLDFKSDNYKQVQTFAHEAVHAATYNVIEKNPKLRAKIDGIRKQALELIQGQHYGLHNDSSEANKVHEFIAEAFSNEAFRNALRSAKVGASNLWEKVVDFVREALGLDPKDRNLLDKIMSYEKDLFGAEKEKPLETIRAPLKAEDSEKPRVRIVGQTESGKPIIRVVTPEQASAATRDAIKDGEDILSELPSHTGWKQSELTARLAAEKAVDLFMQGVRLVNPGALTKRARMGEAVIAKNIAAQMQESMVMFEHAVERRAEWNRRMDSAFGFITGFEKGKKFSDPWLQKVADLYREIGERIFLHDQKMGFVYEPIDNYIYHLFQDPKKVEEWLAQKYGKKWGDPSFTKERTFELYIEALNAGFKPKFTNPEDIMLARQHASSIATMQINMLRDLRDAGLAVEAKGKIPIGYATESWRAPNGELYWVEKGAWQILHNAFKSHSLWADPTAVGTAFRGLMAVKNTLVPIKLMVSLFHPLHVMHIDSAAGITRALQGAISGAVNPLTALKEILQSQLFYKSFWENPRVGGRMRAIWNGRAEAMSESEALGLQYMLEGGFIPEMSEQYRTRALTNFKDAIQQGRTGKAVRQLPFALINALQKPIFEWWIPNLKVASYLNDVALQLKMRPELLENHLQRQIAFRKIAKSIDNRYGEMSYNTLFWNRWVKDLAVMDTLSLGWNLGFLREFGGGGMDTGGFIQKAISSGKPLEQIKKGELWRPLYSSVYVVSALGLGGLLHYALTGQAPKSWKDYVYPAGLNTMFYTREFAAIYKHMQTEGVVEGISEAVANKASGVLGMIHDLWTGKDIYGKEFRDPDAPLIKKLEQDLLYVLGVAEPMSMAALKGDAGLNKETALAVAGFTPEPRYAKESVTEGRIAKAYQIYRAPQQTPFEAAQYSKEYKEVKRLYDKNDPKFNEELNKLAETYDLRGDDVRRIMRSLVRDVPAEKKMFQMLPWPIQKSLLDKMTPEEREVYLPMSNKKHLRNKYEPPKE